ncbi:hypothetical protein LCGC14_1815070 [marine sediment metagenome]|uniref:Uncharacterized protein n=1 Tax=marine sediment metagenome TaxID=412755 RepID=A0A0F9J0F0_9ZZZZ
MKLPDFSKHEGLNSLKREMGITDKLTASKGTVTVIDNPDLTSWVLAGWSLIESVSVGQVKIVKG